MIDAWEHGQGAPTYIQLETLAYKVYRRPIAIFYFPAPPEEATLEKSFRTMPSETLRQVSVPVRLMLRKAQIMQINLSELLEGNNPAKRHILKDLELPRGLPIADIAIRTRQFLGVSYDQQLSWDSAETAVKAWRTALAEHGLFVFKNAFKDDSVSGFCLYDPEFPIIYLNNSTPFTRQVFTLFHELGHLLMGVGGIDTRIDDYLDTMAESARQVEILCNSFAAEILLPQKLFRAETKDCDVSEAEIARLAKKYSISREVVLRKFLDDDRVDNQTYNRWVAAWGKGRRGKDGDGGDYYNTQGAYLGQAYINLVLGQYRRDKISLESTADFLDIKAKYVGKMEARFEKGATAE